MQNFKCLLIHTPNLCASKAPDSKEISYFSEVNFCAMGLYSLGSELKKEGFEVEIIHLGIEKYLDKNFSLSRYIKENGVKFAAFSLHWHPQAYDVIESIRILKQNVNDIFVAVGGFTASFFADEILKKFNFIDAIMKGEGEIPIRKLARRVYLASLKSQKPDLAGIENLAYNRGGKIITNKEKFIATSADISGFEFFDIKMMKNYESYSKIPFILHYDRKNELNNPQTSQGVCLGRGCTGNCTWCGGGKRATELVTGRNFISYRDPKSVINEIKTLKTIGIEQFRFAFDPDPADRSYLLGLLNELYKEFKGDLTALFTVFSLPDERLLEAYRKAFNDNSVISLSPEFCNENLRKKHKSFYFSNQKLEEILALQDRLKISSELYFSIIPGVDEEENKKSENYAKYLVEKYEYVQKYYIMPIIFEPASPWTLNPLSYGLSSNVNRNFSDYYNAVKFVEKSYENSLHHA